MTSVLRLTARQQLHELVDMLNDEQVADVLDYMDWLNEELSEDEWQHVQEAEREVELGNYLTLDELKALLRE